MGRQVQRSNADIGMEAFNKQVSLVVSFSYVRFFMLLFTFCSFVIQIQEVEKQVDKLSGLLKKLQVCKFLIQCFVVSVDFDYPCKEICGCGSMKTVKALD